MAQVKTPVTSNRTGALPVDEIQDANDPSVTGKAYSENAKRWRKSRAVFEGTDAVRELGTEILPQHAGESDDRYDVRRNLAAFYNGYARTVNASVGLILGDGITLDEGMDQVLHDCWENADASGTHGDVIVRKLLTGSIVDSFGGLFADFTSPDSPLVDRSKASAAVDEGRTPSADDEAALGLRPYLVSYRADEIIKEVYETIAGVRVLTLLILKAVVRERVGKFGIKYVAHYRVYTNEQGVIKYSLWKADTNNARPVQSGAEIVIQNQDEIPWSPLLLGDDIPGKPGEYKAPLTDLRDLNIQYHISLTNHLSLESLAYVPTPVRIGAQPIDDPDHPLVKDGTVELGHYPPVVLGPGNTIEAPIVDGVPEPIYWLSPPVDVLEEGRETLVATKADMATMGSAFLSAETRSAETAEGKRIDASASRATLGNISRAVQDCVERAIGFMAKYLNLKGGSITMNDDFAGEGLDTSYLSIILTAYEKKVISIEEVRYVLQTGQLPEDFNNEDVLDLLAAQEAEMQAQADAVAMQTDNNAPNNPKKKPVPTPPSPGGKGFNVVRGKKTGKVKRIIPIPD